MPLRRGEEVEKVNRIAARISFYLKFHNHIHLELFFKFNFNKFLRRAKTRDEMYAYYCTFGEEKNPGNDFVANIINILRESLEGILTNAEVGYSRESA
jgi:hypothetical protein